MEALLLIADAIALLLLAFWSVANDVRLPDVPTTGLFRYIDHLKKPASPQAPDLGSPVHGSPPGRDDPERSAGKRK